VVVAAGCNSSNRGGIPQNPGGPGSDGGGIDFGGDASIGVQGDLTNVAATVHVDNALISFDPVDGAKDYRAYLAPLMADGGVDTAALPGADGGTAMAGGTYRCAGDREAPTVPADGAAVKQGDSAHTWVNGTVVGVARNTADAILGYVYPTAGANTVPVYVLGDPASGSDNTCATQRWDETRVKRYVTSDADRQALIAQGFRDLGIAFHAPAAGATGTVQIYTALSNDFGKPRLYFADGPEKTSRGAGATPAFLALKTATAGAVPLKRVYYTICGNFHDELMAGDARFQRAWHQGNTPATRLQWTGLTGPTKLVIEALDQGCPFQGFLAATSVPNPPAPHQPFFSLADLRATDANREVFVNGQHDGAPRPRAIARSIVDLTPAPPDATLDYRDGFETDPGPFTEVPFNSDFAAKRFTSPKYDVTFYRIDFVPLSMGVMFNEFWVAWADGSADLEAKFRLTPKQKATLPADGSFLHVTMEIDTVSTDRRYPQLFISDRDAPLQDNLPNGATILVQVFGTWPSRMDLQFCDHRTWGVTNQCPRYVTDFYDLSAINRPNPPTPNIGEASAVDRRVRWDVFASTDRIYAMIDGQPVGCGILPAGRMPSGPVSVTVGDVLYHSGVDVPDPPYTFHSNHMKLETRRHIDELGWKSGVAAPPWNDAVVCASDPK